ncbi:putative Late nodulin [Medicago truncatula]|uniref:Nodule Cysteine-Rich (NCR) secreted peptide n=1 Tax=Medicago truncatula TaxID=3880 RepID=A7KH75_MEDTR|nr:nodule-specific cysteine-rich peptide 57 [Medicago truncatula]AES60268.1 Nodule Cysteine-Rich (NCR) secreted peptide [Medicago truncatula]RHN78585.1 putative Late nodulin [Medicago truncatula]
MNHISKFVYALIIFLSVYLVVLDGRPVSCKDHYDCRRKVKIVGCIFPQEKPMCINSMCTCIREIVP